MASNLDSQLSTLTGGQQTMLSWSKVVESYDAVPEAFKNSYKMTVGDKPQFPYTVFAPAIAGFGHKTTEKLLCEVGDTIYIWEHNGNQVAMAEYSLETISDFEIGSILLFSWITIVGMTKAGIISSSTVEFNAASNRHFARFVNKVRPVPDNVDEREQSVERAKFDYLETKNFKFMNYANQSLVGSEKVLHTQWQPQINKSIITLGWHTFYRASALAHLIILTDKQLIIIQDDERSRENHGVRYGGKWHYISLSHIKTVSLIEEHTDNLLTLSLTLSPGERQLEIIFAISQKQEIIQLQDELQKLLVLTEFVV